MLFENVSHGWCVFNIMGQKVKSISYCCNPLEEIYYALENKVKHNFPFQVEFDCEDRGKQGLIEFDSFTYIFSQHYCGSFTHITHVDDVIDYICKNIMKEFEGERLIEWQNWIISDSPEEELKELKDKFKNLIEEIHKRNVINERNKI